MSAGERSNNTEGKKWWKMPFQIVWNVYHFFFRFVSSVCLLFEMKIMNPQHSHTVYILSIQKSSALWWRWCVLCDKNLQFHKYFIFLDSNFLQFIYMLFFVLFFVCLFHSFSFPIFLLSISLLSLLNSLICNWLCAGFFFLLSLCRDCKWFLARAKMSRGRCVFMLCLPVPIRSFVHSFVLLFSHFDIGACRIEKSLFRLR